MSGDAEDDRETHAARISFRATPSNASKLTAIAVTKQWLNARGKPNISRVLNYLIDKYTIKEAPSGKRK